MEQNNDPKPTLSPLQQIRVFVLQWKLPILTAVVFMLIFSGFAILITWQQQKSRTNNQLTTNIASSQKIADQNKTADSANITSAKPNQLNKTLPTTTVKPTEKIEIGDVTVVVNPTAASSNSTQPPGMKVTFPSENQSVTLSSGQNFCVVDAPDGGNQTGLQRRQDINNQGWSSYAAMTTLCYNPPEGANTLSLQYKNSSGKESVIYTTHFQFHRVSDITVTISGRMYRDENCNKNQDGNEGAVATATTVNIFQMPEFYLIGTINSDSSGNFSYSKTIQENATLILQAGPVAPAGYKSNPFFSEPSVTFTSSNRNGSVSIPFVPYENVSACTF